MKLIFARLGAGIFCALTAFAFSSCQTYSYLAETGAEPPAYIRGEYNVPKKLGERLKTSMHITMVEKIDGKRTDTNYFSLYNSREEVENYTPIPAGRREIQAMISVSNYQPVSKTLAFVAESGKKYQVQALRNYRSVGFVIVDEATGLVVNETNSDIAKIMMQKIYNAREESMYQSGEGQVRDELITRPPTEPAPAVSPESAPVSPPPNPVDFPDS